jgi:hypothetical protein
MRKRWRISLLVILAVLVTAPALTCAWRHPSNDRDWAVDQSVLPRVAVQGHFVSRPGTSG